KSLHVMGQVVKNFPLDLRGDLKVKLTQASYLLTFRTLRVFLNALESNITEFFEVLERALRKFQPFAKRAEEAALHDAAKQMIVHLTELAIFGMIKRLSLAIGVVDLKETYAQVKQQLGEDNIPTRLIDVSIKLDHFGRIPESDVKSLESTLNDNITAYN